MKVPALVLSGLLVTAALSAEVTFSGLDLDASSKLLFNGKVGAPAGDYQVWFRSDLASGTPPEPLTYYPESTAFLPALGQLQIQNRFGVWRLDPATGRITSVATQVFGRDPGTGEGRPLPAAYSPDGRNVLVQVAVTAVTGSLELRDVANAATATVTSGLDLSSAAAPALWSPDGQFFVYTKKGSLYYYSLRQAREKRVPEEGLRRLGPGLLSSVTWGSGGELYYLQDQVLYRILPEEFFTRSLYRAQFQTWGISGKLPFPFRPEADRFWLAPDTRSVLVNLGGRTLFLYPLDLLDYYQTAKLGSLTYVPLPQNLVLRKVVWTKDNRITLLASALKGGKEETTVLRLGASSVQVLDPGTVPLLDLTLSPDESLLLLVRRDGVSLRDAVTFADKKTFALDGLVSAYWKDAATILASGRSATVQLGWQDNTLRTLALGSLDQAGLLPGGQLVGRQANTWYVWQAGTAAAAPFWKPAPSDFKLGEAQSSNGSFRVFASDLPSGPYRNTILVRDLKALTTRPLLPPPLKDYEPFPAAEAGPDDPAGDGLESPLRHGSRLRSRQVALAIDALDSSEGLPEVLRSLRDWGFQATFFVNGEFLRRNPQAAAEIAASGHETASLFHIPLDLSSPGFLIDQNFVRQGLARQEDDWFAATGRELGLLWHAPAWVEGPALQAGARAANYRSIGSDLRYPLPADKRVDTSALIESLLKAKKPGSILPLTLGMKEGTTGESFFSRWDLLLNGLAEAGYRGVTVSQMLDQSRP